MHGRQLHPLPLHPCNQVVVDEVEAKEDLQTVREQELVSSRLGHSVEFDVAVVPEREPTQTAEGKHDDEVRRHAVDLGNLYAESGQTLQGSFSAVSKQNFARNYSLESSRRDLHNALLCTAQSAKECKGVQADALKEQFGKDQTRSDAWP